MLNTNAEVDRILEIYLRVRQDQDNLKQLLHVAKRQRYELREILLPRKAKRIDRERAFRNYAENYSLLRNIIDLVQNSVNSHELILNVAKKQHRSKRFIRSIFWSFVESLTKVKRKIAHIKPWFEDISNVLEQAFQNTYDLQQLVIS